MPASLGCSARHPSRAGVLGGRRRGDSPAAPRRAGRQGRSTAGVCAVAASRTKGRQGACLRPWPWRSLRGPGFYRATCEVAGQALPAWTAGDGSTLLTCWASAPLARPSPARVCGAVGGAGRQPLGGRLPAVGKRVSPRSGLCRGRSGGPSRGAGPLARRRGASWPAPGAHVARGPRLPAARFCQGGRVPAWLPVGGRWTDIGRVPGAAVCCWRPAPLGLSRGRMSQSVHTRLAACARASLEVAQWHPRFTWPTQCRWSSGRGSQKHPDS